MSGLSNTSDVERTDSPALRLAVNRDRGESRDSAPPTPPYIRNRIRRFGGLSTPSIKTRKTEVVEVGVANRKVQSFRTAWPPRTARPRDIRGQPGFNAQHPEASPSSPRRAPLNPKVTAQPVADPFIKVFEQPWRFAPAEKFAPPAQIRS